MKTVRFGIAGLGIMGQKHARMLLTDVEDAQLSAVVTSNPAHLSALMAMPGGRSVRSFSSYEKMLASDEIDAVLIATPHRLHVEQAIQALNAGKHVLLEKPAGVAAAEVRELNQVAAQSDRAFGIMLNQRANPVFRRMKELVASGEMGQIRRVNLQITDWLRTEAYFRSSSWRATWQKEGGGVLLNQAVHNLDLYQWICGMPKSLRAFVGYGKWHDIEVEDDVTAVMTCQNGATATLITSTGEYPGSNRFEISMDGGRILMENGRLLVTRLEECLPDFIRNSPSMFEGPRSVTTDETPAEPDPAHVGILNDFCSHVLYGTPLLAPGEEGIHSVILANAVYYSDWTKEEVQFPMPEERYAQLLRERCEEAGKAAGKSLQ